MEYSKEHLVEENRLLIEQIDEFRRDKKILCGIIARSAMERMTGDKIYVTSSDIQISIEILYEQRKVVGKTD